MKTMCGFICPSELLQYKCATQETMP